MTTMYMNRETCKATLMLNEKAASGASQEELNAYVDGLNNTLNQEYMNEFRRIRKRSCKRRLTFIRKSAARRTSTTSTRYSARCLKRIWPLLTRLLRWKRMKTISRQRM